MKKSKWTSAQIELLLKKTSGDNVRMQAFAEIARITGRKANSVRNYFYKFHAKEKNEFVPFTDSEVKNLLREIVLGTSRGESVRSICLKIANNDRSKMLRLQNKYRAILSKNPSQIQKVTKTLESQGFLVKSLVAEPAQIIKMPKEVQNNKLTDTDINNLFMGLVRLIKKNANDDTISGLRNQIENLKTEIERLKSEAVSSVKTLGKQKALKHKNA